MALSNVGLCLPPSFPETGFDLVVLATSAGGLKALKQIVAHLPGNFPIPIVIVQHLVPTSRCLLPRILNQITGLKVKFAEAEEHLQANTIYVAPPDHHLLINPDGGFVLTHTERVNFTRPAADVLFASVAESFQKRAIAVVLTGKGRDGAVGIAAIKRMGGVTIAEDPITAEFMSMPTAAIQTHAVDRVLPLGQIASALTNLVKNGVMNGDGANQKHCI